MIVTFTLTYLYLILDLHPANVSEFKWECFANYLLLILFGAKN